MMSMQLNLFLFLSGVIGPSDAYLADRIANSISETEIPFISYGEFVERVNPSDEGTQARHRFYSGTSLSKRAKVITLSTQYRHLSIRKRY